MTIHLDDRALHGIASPWIGAQLPKRNSGKWLKTGSILRKWRSLHEASGLHSSPFGMGQGGIPVHSIPQLRYTDGIAMAQTRLNLSRF
jgi:hypothetical protein